jgi:hypothetical protein
VFVLVTVQCDTQTTDKLFADQSTCTSFIRSLVPTGTRRAIGTVPFLFIALKRIDTVGARATPAVRRTPAGRSIDRSIEFNVVRVYEHRMRLFILPYRKTFAHHRASRQTQKTARLSSSSPRASPTATERRTRRTNDQLFLCREQTQFLLDGARRFASSQRPFDDHRAFEQTSTSMMMMMM